MQLYVCLLLGEDRGAIEAVLAGHADMRRRKSLAMSIDSGEERERDAEREVTKKWRSEEVKAEKDMEKESAPPSYYGF